MKYLTIIIVLSLQLFADNLYWYSDKQKIQLYNLGYDGQYNSFIYSNSKNIKSKKMVLTNNIIVAFRKKIDANKLSILLNRYNLKLVKIMNIGNGFYILECLDNNSLEIANMIYENEDNIKSSYPDWIYLK
jgi:hypothetical protein